MTGNDARLDDVSVWPYHVGVATTTVKTTYSLDVRTIEALERMARRWKVSKSEALRRAIREASEKDSEPEDSIKALERLQASVRLSAGASRRWQNRVRAERRATSDRPRARSR